MPLSHTPKLGVDSGAKKRIRKGHLTVQQLKSVIDGEHSLQRRTAFKVLYYCALRASELGLQPKDHFDAKRGTLDILRLKGSIGHTYPLEPWVLNDLKRWTSERSPNTPFLFHHPLDAQHPLDRFNIYRWWKEACVRVGLPLELQHPHVLKHSIATHMFDRGDDIYFIQVWLGHKKLENTQVYAEVVGKRLSEGQAIVRALTKEL